MLPDSSTYAALPGFRNPSLPINQRLDDLISRMTVDEKLSQLRHDAAAIERFGIIQYDWWSECLHGVGRAYLATVFPQAIGLAATWDTSIIAQVGAVTSDEARAKHHKEVREYGKTRIMRGLTFFTPNINIFRDPRWGRGQETYGEDPYLMSRIAVAYIRALQGDDERYLKVAATAKHFAVHSGPEALRHTFDAQPTTRDLWQTYLPAFRACIKEAGVKSVMCAYNKIDGTYACQSAGLLNTILRDTWGFDGYVVSDCGADISLGAGCDLICYLAWPNQKMYTSAEPESLINLAVRRTMRVRFELGMFDPPEIVRFASIPYSIVDCERHRIIARRAAQKSMVLLKNEKSALPLKKDIASIAVVGPHANRKDIHWGNYNGTPSYTVTPLDGIRAKVSSGTAVHYTEGCALTDSITGEFARAESLATLSRAVVAVLGLASESLEDENVRLEGEGADKTDLQLPAIQQRLLETLHATGTPVILALVNGSPLGITWADSNVAAIIETWYGGQETGAALTDVLFGDYNPAGRLPVTFYKSIDSLPPFEDYDMEKGRTYRYIAQKPLYPFGYGLSYTTFAYSNLQISPFSPTTADTISVSVDVKNTGTRAGDEVVQLYVSDSAASVAVPARELRGFSRVNLAAGETKKLKFMLLPCDLSLIDASGNRVIEPGVFSISVGGGQPGARAAESYVSSDVSVQGSKAILPK
jgi:beta-glucosidase